MAVPLELRRSSLNYQGTSDAQDISPVKSGQQVKRSIDFLRFALCELTKFGTKAADFIGMILRHTLAVRGAQFVGRERTVQLKHATSLFEGIDLPCLTLARRLRAVARTGRCI